MHAGWHSSHAVAWNWVRVASRRSSGGSRYAARGTSWCFGILVTPGGAVVGFGPVVVAVGWIGSLACADVGAGAGGGGGAAAAQGAATSPAGGSARAGGRGCGVRLLMNRHIGLAARLDRAVRRRADAASEWPWHRVLLLARPQRTGLDCCYFLWHQLAFAAVCSLNSPEAKLSDSRTVAVWRSWLYVFIHTAVNDIVSPT